MLALGGCASAADEGGAQASEEATNSSSEELKTVAASKADATAADCDAAPSLASGDTAAYSEYQSLVSSTNLIGTGSLGNTCTNVCKCCKRGNRFCCSHCDFCSGPSRSAAACSRRSALSA